MRAQVLRHVGPLDHERLPLELIELPDPEPQPTEVRLRVQVCGVCHTELDEIEGRLSPTRLPMVLGHQVVGRVETKGELAEGVEVGDRVGVAWIFRACGRCPRCRRGYENLCDHFQATGRDHFGGYAELMTAPVEFVHPLPSRLTDIQAAPLLCAGAIGYRSLRLASVRDGDSIGLSGFGASGHLVLKLIRHQLPNTKIYVFARNSASRTFALELGATWAGDHDERAPELLQAFIDTTPAWRPIVRALENLAPSGRLVVNAIRKEPADQAALLELDYAKHVWMEKEIKSVANVTRRDVRETLALAADAQLEAKTSLYPLAAANEALWDLKSGHPLGSKILTVDKSL